MKDEDWAILEAGPDHEEYWEAWDDVVDNARIQGKGSIYILHQDGDLWLVPEGMEWSDEDDWFVWPTRP